jgi:hypothetical protein
MAELPAPLSAPLGGEGSSRTAGFEVCIFSGSNPDLAENRVRTVEVGPLIRDAVIAVSAGEQALAVRAAVRTRHSDGTFSLWRISDTDTIDRRTGPPSREELRESFDLNGHELFFSETAPTEGMVEGDYWFDTTTIEPGRVRYTPHRYSGGAWVALDAPMSVASVVAAGAIGAREIRALSVTTEKLGAGAVTAEKIEAGEVNADHFAADALEVAYDGPAGAVNTAGSRVVSGAKMDAQYGLRARDVWIGDRPIFVWAVAKAKILFNGSGVPTLIGTHPGITAIATDTAYGVACVRLDHALANVLNYEALWALHLRSQLGADVDLEPKIVTENSAYTYVGLRKPGYVTGTWANGNLAWHPPSWAPLSEAADLILAGTMFLDTP